MMQPKPRRAVVTVRTANSIRAVIKQDAPAQDFWEPICFESWERDTVADVGMTTVSEAILSTNTGALCEEDVSPSQSANLSCRM